MLEDEMLPEKYENKEVLWIETEAKHKVWPYSNRSWKRLRRKFTIKLKAYPSIQKFCLKIFQNTVVFARILAYSSHTTAEFQTRPFVILCYLLLYYSSPDSVSFDNMI